MINPNNNYEKYGMVFLPWQGELRAVVSHEIREDGLYHIVFQTQVVNNTANWGKKLTVMITAKLCVDGKKVKIWTENIMPKRHYGMPTIVKCMQLKKGQIIEVKMRSDCTIEHPSESVFLLTAPDRFQFDITRM